MIDKTHNLSEVSDEHVFRCAWLLNPGEPPRQNVRITVLEGRVCEIRSLPADERTQVTPMAFLPRLVNAHTHLEFSRLTQPLSPQHPFTDWIRSVIQYRLSEAPAVSSGGVSDGLAECFHGGTGLVGEITTSRDGWTAFQADGPARGIGGVSFREIIGFTADRFPEQREEALRHATLSSGDGISCGLSPHAPYSVHPQLLDEVVDIAARRGLPVAIHLAETRDEMELLDRQSGRFVEFLQSMSLWDSSVLVPGTRPLQYLERLATLPNALAVHGNYFDDREVAYLGQHPNIATVYCPRTHAYFGHRPHPWQKLKAAGATVVLGTDSRASNPDLSIWKELQLAASQTRVPIWELLPMITTTAAAALGFSPGPFRIEVGRTFRVSRVPTTALSITQLQNELKIRDPQ